MQFSHEFFFLSLCVFLSLLLSFAQLKPIAAQLFVHTHLNEYDNDDDVDDDDE